MFAMQYSITLPADYDMAIIRHRVAAKGHLLDDFPSLDAYAKRLIARPSFQRAFAPPSQNPQP